MTRQTPINYLQGLAHEIQADEVQKEINIQYLVSQSTQPNRRHFAGGPLGRGLELYGVLGPEPNHLEDMR